MSLQRGLVMTWTARILLKATLCCLINICRVSDLRSSAQLPQALCSCTQRNGAPFSRPFSAARQPSSCSRISHGQYALQVHPGEVSGDTESVREVPSPSPGMFPSGECCTWVLPRHVCIQCCQRPVSGAAIHSGKPADSPACWGISGRLPVMPGVPVPYVVVQPC